MNRGRLFRRRFDSGMSSVQDKAEELQSKVKKHATALAEQTHDSLIEGGKVLMSWEHTTANHLKAHRGLYGAIAVGLVGFITAKLIFDRFHDKKIHILD